MFKKLLTIIMAGIMILSLAACGSTTEQPIKNNTTNKNEFTQSQTQPNNNQTTNNVITEVPDI